ncbi:MAG: TolC family protein [Calditrichaeota bacterium]|nr:TolC family protein [Calditrichota bacterium]
MLISKVILSAILGAVLISPDIASSQQTEAKTLNLQQCIHIALKNNPQILASQIGVAKLKKKLSEARAGFYPSFNLNADAGRLTAQPGFNAGKTGDNYNTSVSMRYNIFQGGKTVASVHAARHNYEAGKSEYKGSQQDLILAVTEAYYQLLQAEQFTGVAEKSLQRAQSHLDFANARFKNGLASRSDILKAKTEQSNAKLDLIHARNAVSVARGQLNIALGQNVSSPLKIVDDLSEAAVNETPGNQDKFQTLVEQAYEKRPELKKMEEQLQAQKSFIRLAKADYYPSVSLNANYNFNGAKVSQLYQSNYIGLSVSLPLFSGFSRPARVSQEKLELLALEQQTTSLRQQISLEVWNAFLALKEVKERILNTQVFLKDARENLDISEGEYREGVGSMLDVLDAETTFVSAEQRYIEALADYKIAQMVLQRAISGKYLEEILK